MRILYFFFFLSILLGCTRNSGNDKSKSTIYSSKFPALEEMEDFIFFFNKFKEDSFFQTQRVDKPLILLIVDEENIEKTNKLVNYVSFNQKDWDGKIVLKFENIAKDTVNVILGLEDTGVHIEHLFVNRRNKWYLYQIGNFSD
jgi:hypothetical protein